MVEYWNLKSLTNYLSTKLDKPLRFGALVPWANIAMEAELPYLIPHKVTWHFARLVPPSLTTPISDNFLKGMIDAIPTALQSLSHIPLHGVAFGCTSASFSYETSINQYQDESSCLFLSAFDAICYMLKFLDIQRLVLITPYEESITRKEIQALSKRGFQLINDCSLGLKDNIGAVKTAEIIQVCERNVSDDCEAVLISCTALHTLEAIYVLEEKISKPVISSNIALALALVLKCNLTVSV
jgi:maleate isomerase